MYSYGVGTYYSIFEEEIVVTPLCCLEVAHKEGGGGVGRLPRTLHYTFSGKLFRSRNIFVCLFLFSLAA